MKARRATGPKLDDNPAGWSPPYVTPEECDHDRTHLICSHCCPCDACGHSRWELQEYQRKQRKP